MAEKKRSSGQNISTIDKAFRIIDYLSSVGGEASIQEISTALSMHKSTVYRILSAEKAAGYVYQNEDTSDYCLSARFYQIAMRMQRGKGFLQAYTPYARKLNEKYDEVVTVGVREAAIHDVPRYIELYGFRSSHAFSLTLSSGEYSPSHCTATGKCLLAFSDKTYVDRFEGCALEKRTDYTITDWKQLRLELDRIREKGYALDNEEYEVGLVGIATPLFSPDGRIVGAVSMTLPVERFRTLNLANAVDDMRAITDLHLPV